LYLLSNWLPLAARSAGMTFSQAATLGIVLQVGGAIGDFTVGLKMDRYGPDRVVGLMFAACAAFSLLIAFFSTSVAIVSTLVFLLGYVLMSANAGLFALGAAHYPTAFRATGVSWVFGIGRLGAILGAGFGAMIMKWGWTINDIFIFLTAPVLVASIAIHCKRRRDCTAPGTVTDSA
jgi:MFS transporter, AAHS family, 4-hydroxybenzoate transporter